MKMFFICYCETCFCFVLQINILAFLFVIHERIMLVEGFTPFNTLFIFVIYFHDYCFTTRCYSLPITENFTFCSISKGRLCYRIGCGKKKKFF